MRIAVTNERRTAVVLVAVLAVVGAVAPAVGVAATAETHAAGTGEVEAVGGSPSTPGGPVADRRGTVGRPATPSRIARTTSGARSPTAGTTASAPGPAATAPGVAGASGTRATPPGVTPDGPDPNATVHNVTLVTGQTVRVLESGNRTFYRIDADVAMHRVRTPRGTYVYPETVDFGTYDPALFNVDLLVERGLTDGESGSIPVIVQFDRSRVGAGDGGLELMTAGRGIGEFSADRRLESIGAVAGRVDKGALGDRRDGGIDALAARPSPRIERVYLDRIYEVTLNDSTEAIAADRAREQFDVSGDGVRVAVLDTGVDDTHPDLDDGTVVDAEDFTDEGTTDDGIGHGTHVAGIVAGDGDASDGEYVGVAPDASIMNLRVLDSAGRGRTSWIIDGIEYAVNNSADVLSISLGSRPAGDTPMVEAVNAASDRGVAVVVAAGNSGPRSGTIATPAIAPRVITVGAYDEGTGGVARFSSRGPTSLEGRVKPDVLAPGAGIVSACSETTGIRCTDGDYTALDGTSMAAPHVSGVVALMLDRHPGWSPAKLKDVLVSTAGPVSGSPTPSVYDQGGGLVNASRAVEPGVVVRNASLGFGTVTGDRRLSRTVTLVNRGDETRTLSVDATLYRTENRTRTGRVAVNRSSVELAPGETAGVRVTVDGTGPRGVYSGRLTFEGDRRNYSVVFGYTRAKRVVIEKRALGDGSVEDDTVWVFPESAAASARALEVEDGSVAFPAVVDTNYTVLSTGTDEDTGQPIVLLEEFTGNGSAALDESDTVTYRIDAGELRRAHGPLRNLSLQAELRLGYYGLSVLNNYTDVRSARLSANNESSAIVEAMLVPEGAHDRSPDDNVDSPALYHVAYGTDGVSGPETFVVDRSRLARDERQFHRTASGNGYAFSQELLMRSPVFRWRDSAYEWRLDGRTEQTVYMTPGGTTYYSYFRYREGDPPARDDRLLVGTYAPTAGDRFESVYNRRPYVPTLRWSTGYYGSSLVAYFQRDQPPRRAYFHDPRATTNVSVSVGGEQTTNVSTNKLGTRLSPRSPDDGEVIEIAIDTRTRNPLSSRTVATYRITYREPDDPSARRANQPPEVGEIRVEGIGPAGGVDDPTPTVRVNVSDEDGIADVVVMYAAAEDPDVAFDDGRVTNPEGWVRADLTEVGNDTYRVEINGTRARSPVDLAVLATDESDDTTAVTVYDAFRIDASTPSPVAAYANETGHVTYDALQRAVQDWLANDISTETLQRLITAWATGEKVE